MKFMKLGSKPDSFQELNNIRFVASEIASDFVVIVDDISFHLHKFPLLSKSRKLKKLAAEALDHDKNEVELLEFPGGAEAFEQCAKFCYGITITLNAFNLVAVRCAADYLEMTETVEKGNLIFKLEVFLNSSIFHGWKDSTIVLQSTKAFLPLAEDLKIVSRAIDAIASKTLVDPSKVDFSFTYLRLGSKTHESSEINPSPPWNGIQSRRHQSVPMDWWIEDIAELEIDFYWRVMVVIKSTGRIAHNLIGEALRFYSLRWLPGISKDQNLGESMRGNNRTPARDCIEIAAKHRILLDKIVSLIPSEKGSTSCSFLLKLLKAATILNASTSKIELARCVGRQLEEASLNDLLIPSLSYENDSLYDVDLVQSLVEHFMMQDQSPPISPPRAQQNYEKRRTRSAENIDFMESKRLSSATHSSKLRVAKLIDGYLAEIARDAHLPIFKFTALAQSIPDFARPVHDGLYRAIDIYLKEHPGLTKAERKNICRLLDCKKLSMEACIHAAQNEQLPLRVVVQVLFFEQVRAAMKGGLLLHELPGNVKALMSSQEVQSHEGTSGALEHGWESMHQNFKVLKGDLASTKAKISGAECSNIEQEAAKSSKLKSVTNIPSKPKKFLWKLWLGRNLSDSAKSCVSSTRPSKLT